MKFGWMARRCDSSEAAGEVEPIYGPVYLPRKFKIGIAVPPSNDVDVYSQDLGYIAIVENDKLVGFNVCVGGGMGMTHGDTATYPQLARVIGFCNSGPNSELAEKTVTIQRDYGNRSVRKNARFKYTIDRHGLEWFVDELHRPPGLEAGAGTRIPHSNIPATAMAGLKARTANGICRSMFKAAVFQILSDYKLRTGLREIAKIHTGDFRLTPNQNLVDRQRNHPEEDEKSSSCSENTALTEAPIIQRCAGARFPA